MLPTKINYLKSGVGQGWGAGRGMQILMIAERVEEGREEDVKVWTMY